MIILNIKKLSKASHNIRMFIIIGLIVIISIVNIIDGYSFLSKLDTTNGSVSLQDIITYVLLGLNSNSRTSLIDMIRFSIPYFLILFYIGVYLTDILDDSKKYICIIRYKNYKEWAKKTITRLVCFIIEFFSIYYFILILFALIFTNEQIGFSNTFYMLYPFYDKHSGFIELLIYDWGIEVLWGAILGVCQFLIALFTKNIFKSFLMTSLVVVIFSFLGKFDFYNPMMLSKHSLMNTTIGIHPSITIILVLIMFLLVNLLIPKLIKIYIRRSCI